MNAELAADRQVLADLVRRFAGDEIAPSGIPSLPKDTFL